MRNRFFGAFVIAAVMSVALLGNARIASADQGGPGGPSRSTCAFLQGLLYKVGAPEVVGVIFERVFGCGLNW
jgi:hypothetical protein